MSDQHLHCINCGIATWRRNPTIGLRQIEDEGILSVIQQWVAPQVIKVTSGPSLTLHQGKISLGPDFNPVITEIKSEADLIKQEVEDPQSDDTLSLAEDADQLSDADQPSEDLISLSNAQVPLSNAPDPLSDVKVEEVLVGVDEAEVTRPVEVTRQVELTTPVKWTTRSVEATRAVEGSTVPLPFSRNDCYKLIKKQANQINKLSERCAKQRKKLHSCGELVRRRDKRISNLRAELEALRSFIGECGWEVSSSVGGKIDVRRIQIRSPNTVVGQKKPNRQLLIVKRDYKPPKSSLSAPHTPDTQTPTLGIKRPSVILQDLLLDTLHTSNNRRKSSVGVKRTLQIQEKSSVSKPDKSNVLQKSSVSKPDKSNVLQKSSVSIPDKSNVLQKSSVSIPDKSNVLQKSSVSIPDKSNVLQKSSVSIPDKSNVLQKSSVSIPDKSNVLQKSSVSIPDKSNVLQKSSVSIPDKSNVLQKSSVSIPDKSNVLQKSSVSIPDKSNVLQKSSVSIPDKSNVLQKSSVSIPDKSNVLQKSSVSIPDKSNVLQKSSVGVKRMLNIQEKSLVTIPATSDVLQKSSVGVKRILNNPSIAVQPKSVVPQTSSVGFQRTSDVRQNALVIQIDGMHDTVPRPKLVRLDDNSMETG